MSIIALHQVLDPAHTSWHITFGTYGTRLHGDARPTVDKQHNQLHEPFLAYNPDRVDQERLLQKFPARCLSLDQRAFVEHFVPVVCDRGGWCYRISAAGPDHIHLLCDVAANIHGEKVRRLVKRWLGQALNEKWPLSKGATWWAEEGSNKAIRDEAYLNNAFRYILKQRPTPFEARESAGGEDAPAR